MARHKTKPPSNAGLSWERLSSLNIWSPGLLVFAAVVSGVATILMDYLRTGNRSWLWSVTFSVSLAFAVVLVLLAKRFLLPRFLKKHPGQLNLLIAGIVGGLKNLLVALMATALGLESQVGLLFRFVGGVLMGAAIIVVYAGMSGSRSAHARAMLRLNEIRNDLLGSRENLDVLLADELEGLQEKSRESVLPKIAQISELLHSSSDASQVAEEISETVATRLRPLMEEISVRTNATLRSNPESPIKLGKVPSPSHFVARDVIKPLLYCAYSLPAASFLSFYFQGPIGAVVAVAATLLFAGFMWLFKVLVFPKRSTPGVLSYVMLTVASILAPVVGLYVMGGSLGLTASQSVLLPFACWLIYIFTVLTLSPMILHDLESGKLEALIETENTILAKEIALFEQKVWVFKRRWLFMLHGTVQSALTAALTRLQTFAESDPYQVSLVQADLERAEKALQTLPSNEIDFESAVRELQDSWAGVCAITVNVDMRASRAMDNNKGSAYCVNEILKESIGNAVRHGTATAALVSITREKDDFIDIEVQNDGGAPPKRRKGGIGSRMLDDITVSWSLARSGRLTTLKARLPL